MDMAGIKTALPFAPLHAYTRSIPRTTEAFIFLEGEGRHINMKGGEKAGRWKEKA